MRKTLLTLACLVSLQVFAQTDPNATPQPATTDTPESDTTQKLETVEVTGSRIPRAQIEGPAPVVTITSKDIRERGFSNVPDIMSSLTQNLGEIGRAHV